MNKVILMGRLTKDPEVRYTQGATPLAIGRYTLAVDRRFKHEGDSQTADFINCVCFGKSAEFAGRYLQKGTKIVVSGRIQTGSYTNRDGRKVYTTEAAIEEQDFAESKAASQNREVQQPAPQNLPEPMTDADGFMAIPDGIDEELPFA